MRWDGYRSMCHEMRIVETRRVTSSILIWTVMFCVDRPSVVTELTGTRDSIIRWRRCQHVQLRRRQYRARKCIVYFFTNSYSKIDHFFTRKPAPVAVPQTRIKIEDEAVTAQKGELILWKLSDYRIPTGGQTKGYTKEIYKRGTTGQVYSWYSNQSQSSQLPGDHSGSVSTSKKSSI